MVEMGEVIRLRINKDVNAWDTLSLFPETAKVVNVITGVMIFGQFAMAG